MPIGYADGLIRKNQGRKVYINDSYFEIVGRVCMDQTMVRVDERVKAGDKVEILVNILVSLVWLKIWKRSLMK